MFTGKIKLILVHRSIFICPGLRDGKSKVKDKPAIDFSGMFLKGSKARALRDGSMCIALQKGSHSQITGFTLK